MTHTTVSARLDTSIKAEAENILGALGLSHSAAISALYSQIVLQRGMPFDLKLPVEQAAPCGLTDSMRNSIAEIAQHYGVERVWLFRLRARSEAKQGSDIDLRIDKGTIKGLELGGFVHDLEQALGVPVDVATTTSLPEDFLRAISQDVMLLYER
ncbi:type II toxin-antitoxin system RelB/DinJ family antitoxin [Gordonibacter sp.]|uniref:type II toxin-antitoxin system RelB/DinJ family antitoxin n=1 Tax=Gordonibacter sp. TaxID=1968902 RepID=UPI002FCB4FCB